MLTVPNLLSLMRLPLAIAFLQESPLVRAVAIALALFTDGLDGYVARKFKSVSYLGTVLDPITDKLFALVALSTLYFEQKIELWQVSALMGRDFAVLIFGSYLLLKDKMNSYRIQAILTGKLFTFCLFPVLLMLVLGYKVPDWTYYFFTGLGVIALIELCISANNPNFHHTS